MLDYSTIQDLKAHATNEAVRKGLRPCRIDTCLINIFESGQTGKKLIPNFGDYIPLGWERVEEFFVDKTGFDFEGPALSWPSFARALRQYNDGSHGIAVTEEGEFQVYVTIFKEVKND